MVCERSVRHWAVENGMIFAVLLRNHRDCFLGSFTAFILALASSMVLDFPPFIGRRLLDAVLVVGR